MKQAVIAAVSVAAIAACQTERVPMETEITSGVDPARVKTSGLQAGPMPRTSKAKNPFAGDAYAVAEGKRYFQWFNCHGCHGAIGGGSIGPPLRDADWIYGGEPDQIYASILQGRPQGMPSYGGRIADDVAWRVVAFIQSLGGVPAADEPMSASLTSAGRKAP